MKPRFLLVVLLLLAPLTPSISATPPKAGATCSKAGITKNYNGKKFTCLKKGKILVWSKGIEIKRTASVANTDPGPILTPTPLPTTTRKPVDYVDFKKQIVYGIKDGELIRRADSRIFFDSDSRIQGSFSLIRQRAYEQLNRNPRSKFHPNIEFAFDIRPSFPSNVATFLTRELDEAGALWNEYFKSKTRVNVYMVTEKDREYVAGNRWLQRNLVATSNAPGFKSEFDRFDDRNSRPFIGGGGGYWETNGEWSGNLYFSIASWADLDNINAEWPMIAKHEFLHIVQDYAFYKEAKDRSRDLHQFVQSTHFREGSANAISFLTGFRNLGWSSDALDWNFVMHTRNFRQYKTISSESDAILLMQEMECLKECEILSSSNPDQLHFWTYSFGAIMWEWVLGTYGLEGYIKILDALANSTSFDQVIQKSLGLSKGQLYSRIAPYILETINRTSPYID
jgi:hypothetical protein